MHKTIGLVVEVEKIGRNRGKSFEQNHGYGVVPIDGDYSGLDESVTTDFDENYCLLTNNCGHYIMDFLATHYNGDILSKEFFENMSWNPVPAISAIATGINVMVSSIVNDLQKRWDDIFN